MQPHPVASRDGCDGFGGDAVIASLPPRDVMGPRLAQWVADAAQSKGAPADYVFAAVLAVAGATIGNVRWAAIWRGWAEPPVIWTMCIGLPSAGKSPAIDAALQPLRKAERPLREATERCLGAWAEKAEVAKLMEQTWKEAAKAAIKAGETPPERPKGCDAGPAPHIPRLVVNDGTIERRVLGMRRGDIVLAQITSTVMSIIVGTLRDLLAGNTLIDYIRRTLRDRGAEVEIGTGSQNYDKIFVDVWGFAWPVMIGAIVIGIAAAICPALRAANVGPARVMRA